MTGSFESFLSEVHADSRLRVEKDLGDGFVLLRSEEAERRQAIHDVRSTEDVAIELLRNSRDARASQIFLTVDREGPHRILTVIDNGDGVPVSMQQRIFEPRVTSKLDTMAIDKWGVHGRGMALYSISVNAELAQVEASEPGKGCALRVKTNLEKLGEKRDQSSFPMLEASENGILALRGPRNLLRTACEFALDCRNHATVWLGSATEIAAALYQRGREELPQSVRAFAKEDEVFPVVQRLALASDPASFQSIAESLGLAMSVRSARRIMDGDIAPVKPLLALWADHLQADTNTKQLLGINEQSIEPATKPSVRRDARSLSIAPEDMDAFKAKVSEAFAELARDYYLEAGVEPTVRLRKGVLTVAFPVEKQR